MHEIKTVHKEKVIKLKCLLYTNSTSSVGYWREGGRLVAREETYLLDQTA